jgi:ParB/RepB/Spo0J family partition protein
MIEMRAGRETRLVPIALIDPPALDARVRRDDEHIEELGRDIARRGQLYPAFVFVTGERFEMVEGETRRLAMRRQGLAEIECYVYPSKSLALEGVKYAGNIFRTDMSPADEAKILWELFNNECEHDIERVCALVGKSLNYVSNRIKLVDGDDLVFEAVRAGQIKLGVAELLNQIDKADFRRHYLRHAIEDGATVATVTGWLSEYRKLFQHQAPGDEHPATPPASFTPAANFNPMRCELCGRADHRIPLQVSIHASCKEAILDDFTAQCRGEKVVSA